jgi:hypothetical protein
MGRHTVPDKSDWMAAIKRRHDLTQKRLGDEIRKLMESPDHFSIAQALADAFAEDLAYLNHFSALIDGYGRPVDMVEVKEILTHRLEEKFLLLTGRPYQFPIQRNYEFDRHGPQM